MLCGYCYLFSWLDGVGIARGLQFLRTNSGYRCLTLTFITNRSVMDMTVVMKRILIYTQYIMSRKHHIV